MLLAASASGLLLYILAKSLDRRLAARSGSHRVGSHAEQVSLSFTAMTHRSLICLDMVKNACSTLVAFLAEVSRNGIPSSSANALAVL